jgi:pyruvate dehydrogenase E2 component (dihydrolipoamide acetyltransferase)
VLTKVIMPKTGMYMEDILLLEWTQKEGTKVDVGDALFTLETDKITADVEAEEAGWLHHVMAAGTAVPIGQTVALIASTEEEYHECLSASSEPSSSDAVILAESVASADGPPATSLLSSPLAVSTRSQHPPVSPRARRLMSEHGLSVANLGELTGTGPGGRIIDDDIARYLASASSSALRVSKEIPLTGVRGTIAARLLEGVKTSVQLTSTLEVDVSRLLAWQDSLRAGDARPAPSFTAILLKVVARALVLHPLLNARIIENRIELLKPINLAFAVQTDAGVLVPVVRDVEGLSILEIDRTIAALVQSARDGTLTRDDIQDGTFTVSNSGMYEVDITTAILNPPQVAILWVGRATDRPVVVDGAIEVRPMIHLCLTYDHRAIDGAPAAQFLGQMRELFDGFNGDDESDAKGETGD